MSFYLKGIFTTDTDESIVVKAKQRWAEIRSKTINSNSKGLGMVGPDANRASSFEEYERAQAVNYRIEDELPNFSKQFPDTKFAFLFVDCWGGYCQYSGYVCQDGEKTIDLSEQLGETVKQEEQDENLKSLMNALGIDLGDKGYFEPFRRNYFD